ncbi:MAG: hypothetical protein JWQ55_2611, partial [Rhodopila sp.]|nr:hypothetical protein [Rhodopila sp.]
MGHVQRATVVGLALIFAASLAVSL